MRINIEEIIARQQQNESLRQAVIDKNDNLKALQTAVSSLKAQLDHVMTKGLNYDEAKVLLEKIQGYCIDFGLPNKPSEQDLDQWVGSDAAAGVVSSALEQLTENLDWCVEQQLHQR